MLFSLKLLETLFIFNQLEKNIKIYYSKKTNKNIQFILCVFNIYKIFFFLKNSLSHYYNTLSDLFGLDSSLYNLNTFFQNKQYFVKIIGYNMLNYKLFQRTIFLNFWNYKSIYSIDKLFFNANWLERELIEFFNLNIIAKSDTRNLLLDYNFTGAPLLKSFPTEGYQELYFNFNTYSLDYINCEFIEL